MAIEQLVTKKMPSTSEIIEEIHLNFVRNYAIRKAILESEVLKDIEIFKIISNSCFNIALTEWCKLFGSERDQSHWKNCNERGFSHINDVLQKVNIPESEFESLKNDIKNFRDKYVSHADIKDIEELYVPYLSKVVEMVFFSYEIFSIRSFIYNKDLKLEFKQIYNDTQNIENQYIRQNTNK